MYNKQWELRLLRWVATFLFGGLHRNTPQTTRLLVVFVAAYTASPLDWNSEIVQNPTYADDVGVLAALSVIAYALVPPEVWRECQIKASVWSLRHERKVARICNALLLVALFAIVALWNWVWFVVWGRH